MLCFLIFLGVLFSVSYSYAGVVYNQNAQKYSNYPGRSWQDNPSQPQFVNPPGDMPASYAPGSTVRPGYKTYSTNDDRKEFEEAETRNMDDDTPVARQEPAAAVPSDGVLSTGNNVRQSKQQRMPSGVY